MASIATAPLSVGRGNAGAQLAAVNGRYYFVGGTRLGGPNHENHARSWRVSSYDPVTATWQEEIDFPIAISAHGVVSAGDDLVIVGGVGRNDENIGLAEVYLENGFYQYSTTTGVSQFQSLAGGFLETSQRMALVYIAPDVYLFRPDGTGLPVRIHVSTKVATQLTPTGFNFGLWADGAQIVGAWTSESSDVYLVHMGDSRHVRYNVETNVATLLTAPVPAAAIGSREGPPTYTRVGDDLHLIGGHRNDANVGADVLQHWIYSPTADTWTQQPDIHAGFAVHCAAYLEGRGQLLLAGGSLDAYNYQTAASLVDVTPPSSPPPPPPASFTVFPYVGIHAVGTPLT